MSTSQRRDGVITRLAAFLRVLRRKKRTERIVLDLAVAMASTPAEIPRELFARLREVFDEAQLVELAVAIAWENFRSRFNRVFGVQPSGFSEGSFCALPEPAAGT